VHPLHHASGSTAPWLTPPDPAAVRQAIAKTDALGVKAIYLTGGQPFSHRAMLPLLSRSREVAPGRGSGPGDTRPALKPK
jgi:hypothetical protein